MTGWIPRAALEAPLDLPGGVAHVGRALWLYMLLVSAANGHGTAIQSRPRLAEHLAVPEAEIDRWLARLVEAKLIRLQSPSPYLVIALPFWRSSVVAASENAASHREVPVSSSKQQHGAAAAAEAAEKKNKNKSSSRDGGPGEGKALAAEAREILGEADAAEVQDLLTQYPAPLVRKALRRVQLTPAAQIRKSRAALFRFLLAKFSDDLYADTPPDHPRP